VRYGNLNLVETTGQSPLHAPTEGRPETARRGIDSSAGTAAGAKELLLILIWRAVLQAYAAATRIT